MGHFSIGVDLGGTNLRIAAYTPENGVGRSISLRTRLEAGPNAVVEDMCVAIRELLAEHLAASDLVGICVASPGPLELPAGVLHSPPNLPGWDGFNFRNAVEERLNMPVDVENDANVAALAECYMGSGRLLGVDSLCMLTLGTGVGNGIVLDGKILRGANGLAGEAGHVADRRHGHPGHSNHPSPRTSDELRVGFSYAVASAVSVVHHSHSRPRS